MNRLRLKRVQLTVLSRFDTFTNFRKFVNQKLIRSLNQIKINQSQKNVPKMRAPETSGLRETIIVVAHHNQS